MWKRGIHGEEWCLESDSDQLISFVCLLYVVVRFYPWLKFHKMMSLKQRFKYNIKAKDDSAGTPFKQRPL